MINLKIKNKLKIWNLNSQALSKFPKHSWQVFLALLRIKAVSMAHEINYCCALCTETSTKEFFFPL